MNLKENLFSQYPALKACEDSLNHALDLILSCYRGGGTILLCGNGGSCADCEHISGELLKGFRSMRPIPASDRDALDAVSAGLGDRIGGRLQRGISAIPLPSLTSVLSAYANDVDSTLVYAQLVYALGDPTDLLFCLSTSGNSKNVIAAAQVAKSRGMAVIALTGRDGGCLKEIADCAIVAPANETYQIQEYHLPIYHYLCAETECILFEEEDS